MPERNTYTTYSIGCAVVWTVILLLARRRLDAQARHELEIVCGGWWMGWTSATIARIGYPPPKQLTPAGEKRLRIVSIVLVALGLTSTIRMFATSKRPPSSAPDAWNQQKEPSSRARPNRPAAPQSLLCELGR